jgi:hypothetical protein
MLQTYCQLVLYKNPHLKQIIGIATEPPPRPGYSDGLSEDMIMLEAPSEWSAEHLAELERLRKHFDIFREDRIRTGQVGVPEYPDAKPEDETHTGSITVGPQP